MSQMDIAAAIADSIQTQYASMLDSLLLACERLEAEKAALARERDEALAARDRAIAAYKGVHFFRDWELQTRIPRPIRRTEWTTTL